MSPKQNLILVIGLILLFLFAWKLWKPVLGPVIYGSNPASSGNGQDLSNYMGPVAGRTGGQTSGGLPGSAPGVTSGPGLNGPI